MGTAVASGLIPASQPAEAATTQQTISPTTVPTSLPSWANIVKAAPTTQPLSISATDAVLTSLENNQDLIVDRLTPQIQRTAVSVQRAAFDPDITFDGSSQHTKSQSPTTQPHKYIPGLAESLAGDLGITQYLPTGTAIAIDGSTDISQHLGEPSNELFTSRLGIGVTQHLLRGYGLDVNLASLRQAQIDVRLSQYQLRGLAESVASQVLQTYWDYAVAKQQIEIFTQSLELARRQLDETAQRIQVGSLAPTELAAAQSEVAVREEDLINARSNLAKTRLNLIRLTNPGVPGMWDREILLKDYPIVPDVVLGSVQDHVAVAMRMRPDLNQARLQIQRNALDIVQTRNGLLPKMDLFINLGRTGYADSFGGSVHGADALGYDVQFGISAEYPPINRAARANYTQSVLTRTQLNEALKNVEQLAQVDVRTAYIEVVRSRELVTATAVTLQLEKEKLRAETEKFRVGKSTSLLVAAASRDLLASQIAQVQSVVTNLKALVQLYQLEGTLLVRLGIQAPGFEPVMLAAK